MPTWSAKSSVPHHSNYWENCTYYGGYNSYCRFNKEQYYEGEFFRDSIHGEGSYTWDELAVYEGGFYSNSKEGYAGVSFPNNSYFEGLFIKNEPFGPGIFTYANGRQDAGFWVGRNLVRLSRAVDFIIPRLAPTSAAKIKLFQFRRLIPLDEKNWDVGIDIFKKCGYPFEHFYSPFSSLIYDPRSIFFDRLAFEKTYFKNYKEIFKEFTSNFGDQEVPTEELDEEVGLERKNESVKEIPVPSHCLCAQNEFQMDFKDAEGTDICDAVSRTEEHEMGILAHFTKFGTLEDVEEVDEGKNEEGGSREFMSFEGEEEEDENSHPPNIVSWNRTELCTEMLKQIFRYRAFEDKLSFNLGKLMIGARTAFRRTGRREMECLHFLKMCSIGPPYVIKDLLCTFKISEELMDARGNNSLMFAAATDQHEIIDILLDYGVDVNTFNDENLTPLNLCLLRRLALANGISNWEAAFLPKEIEGVSSEYVQTDTWHMQESIPSLDRIFGDGMSINDSKSGLFDLPLQTAYPSPVCARESAEKDHLQHKRPSEESRDFSDLSQITILNISKSPGSHSLVQTNYPDEHVRHVGVKRSSSASLVKEPADLLGALGSNQETPRVYIKIIPKSNKREEFQKSVGNSNSNKYLFEFVYEKNPNEKKKRKGSGKLNKRKNSRQIQVEEEEVEEEEEEMRMDRMADCEMCKRTGEIDKTIGKLLKRGADPNISEVPKPSIHLGVYTKDLNVMYTLLSHGANANSQLYPNEGLLTPLHVVALLPSAREYVDICGMLLNFGADPLIKTSTDFCMCGEDKGSLDPEIGRIPLQLLCMRPDVEYADPDDNLLEISLILARENNKKCFYNGHSYLSLAMLSGNIKLLKALLETNLYDPNETLEKDRGTALHVLVSTELQRKTKYQNSIAMCDILIAAGANPLKKFKKPSTLLGNCVDYGYREIEAEKEARRTSSIVSKNVKIRTSKDNATERHSKDKTGRERTSRERNGKPRGSKDYLDDHIRVVEYLGKIASKMSRGTDNEKQSADGKKKKRGGAVSKESTRGVKTEEDTVEKDEQNSKPDEDAIKPPDDKKTKEPEPEETKTKKVPSITEDDDDNDKEKRVKKKTDKKEKKKEVEVKVKEVKPKKENPEPTFKPKTNLDKQVKDSSKNVTKPCAETFPEKLRQNILRIYGNCVDIDVNQFLVPYVVLRDGQLYYRFDDQVRTHKEQYSLI